MIVRVVEAAVCGSRLLRVTFNDGMQKTVDPSSLLSGPVFEPLRNPAYFAQMRLDPVCGTVVWPNGADFAPEALRDLAAVEEVGAPRTNNDVSGI
jgi:hypothetical protein